MQPCPRCALLAELRWQLLSHLSAFTGRELQGLQQGARYCKGNLLGGTKKKLRILDDVVAWQRHITSEKAQGLLEELTGQLNLGGERKGKLKGAGGRASAGLTEEARAEEGGAEGAGGKQRG